MTYPVIASPKGSYAASRELVEALECVARSSGVRDALGRGMYGRIADDLVLREAR